MSSLRQNFTEIVTQSVETEPRPQPAVKAAYLGRGTGVCGPGMSPAGSPGTRPGLQLPPQGCSQGPGGVALPSRALCAGALPAARGPHATLGMVVMVEVPQAEPLHLQPGLQHPGRTGGVRTLEDRGCQDPWVPWRGCPQVYRVGGCVGGCRRQALGGGDHCGCSDSSGTWRRQEGRGQGPSPGAGHVRDATL